MIQRDVAVLALTCIIVIAFVVSPVAAGLTVNPNTATIITTDDEITYDITIDPALTNGDAIIIDPFNFIQYIQSSASDETENLYILNPHCPGLNFFPGSSRCKTGVGCIRSDQRYGVHGWHCPILCPGDQQLFSGFADCFWWGRGYRVVGGGNWDC